MVWHRLLEFDYAQRYIFFFFFDVKLHHNIVIIIIMISYMYIMTDRQKEPIYYSRPLMLDWTKSSVDYMVLRYTVEV